MTSTPALLLFWGACFGWIAARLIQRPSGPRAMIVPSLSRKERLSLFGQCELCSEPACGNLHDVDEGTTIRLCTEHLGEAVRYHQCQDR